MAIPFANNSDVCASSVALSGRLGAMVSAFLFAIALAITPPAMAAPLDQARISRVIEDVRLLPVNAAPRQAAVNDEVQTGTAVRTGVDSRAELTFTDATITRIGQNTIFSFSGGTRDVDLESGAILLQVPPHGNTARIVTPAVTAAISGGTGICSSNTLADGSSPLVKLLMLEGAGQFCRGDDCVTVRGGEMTMMTPDGQFARPTRFNVKLVFTTSRLVRSFPPLPNEPLIQEVIATQQQEEKSEHVDDALDARDLSANASASPPPPVPPGKFGPPSIIESPVPYVITSETQIQTDPTITTNGVTDFGKIYRGAATDGSFSAWALGSTSGFDVSSGFDGQLGGGSGAAFKFRSLVLAGDPMVDTTGGETNLAFIGVDSITSGAPGGILGKGGFTFGGVDGVLLATVNGPITLGPGFAFFGMDDLTFYARGNGSDLTLNAGIFDVLRTRLYAGRDITLNSSIDAPLISMVAGQNINLTNFQTAVTATESSGDVTLRAGNDIVSAGSISIMRSNGGGSPSLDITLNAGHDIVAGSEMTVGIDNSQGTLGNANIALIAGNNLSVGGGGEGISSGLSLGIFNAGGQFIGDAAILLSADSMNVGGDLSTVINNTGGMIDGEARIDMNVSGDATVGNNATVEIDGSEGAQSAAINFNGGNYEIGSTFRTTISGDGTIAFNDSSIHADVIKAGVFGPNGTLNIGGGMLSADSQLKLYAPGSSGSINFVDNVTLNSPESAVIIAAHTVTIFNNVVVTIGGPTQASVYADVANYTGFGGNGSTTGTFGGAGANDPLALSEAPPFDEPRPQTATVVHVNNSGELLSLLDNVAPDGGKITLLPSNRNRIRNGQRLSNGAGLAHTERALNRTDAVRPRTFGISPYQNVREN